MSASNKKVFFYHAHALGVGGYFVKPIERVIQSQASATLAITGGYGSTRVEDFRFEEILSFKSAHSQVAGSYNPRTGNYDTLATATVEGLNIVDMVTADRVVARLSSSHSESGDEPKIATTGSHFVNLRVAGHPIDVKIDSNISQAADTYTGFRDRFKRDKEFQRSLYENSLWGKLPQNAPQYLINEYGWQKPGDLNESKGLIRCSLVQDLRFDTAEITRFGYILDVPQFGRIYLAELLISRYARRLNMLRVEMGCPAEGSVNVGYGDSNGSTFP
jgi:hypothetical protein